MPPKFNQTTNTISIPKVSGVNYYINDSLVTGAIVIEEDTVVVAKPSEGRRFRKDAVTEWEYAYVPSLGDNEAKASTKDEESSDSISYEPLSSEN